MPFNKFNRALLKLKPLSERISDIGINIMKAPIISDGLFTDKKYINLSNDIRKAKECNATVLMMYGGHVIRSGCSPYMIKMMEDGYINHFATNGAGAIHDFEFSFIGATCESVAKYISEGQFGLWNETGLINEALSEGIKHGMGAGEAIGWYIEKNDFPYKKYSLLAAAYRNHTPATVHIGIGNDIIHEHLNADGRILGEASYTDFLIYTQSVSNLDHGVFLNFGSAVTGPEVYLKALAMARNVAHQQKKSIYDITTAVFDLFPIEGEDYNTTPEKSDPRYYFRPWKTILTRTVADGGKSYYFQGSHDVTIPSLYTALYKT